MSKNRRNSLNSKITNRKIFNVLILILILVMAGIAYMFLAYFSMINYAFKDHPTEVFQPGAEFLYSQPNQKSKSSPWRFVVLGDSTSVGQGAKIQSENYSCQYAQLVLLKQHPAVKIYNLAVSGAKTKDVLLKQVEAAIALDPDLIMISIGANDVTGLTNAEEFRRQYAMILQQLTRADISHKAKIVLLNIPSFSTSPLLWEPYRSAAHFQAGKFNEIISALVKSQGDIKTEIRIVDIFGKTEADFRRFPKLNFSQDNFHPSAAGYKVWTRVIAQTLN